MPPGLQPRNELATDRMYRWHAPLYDATRWLFLPGRRELVEALPADADVGRIVEVGSGTGYVSELLLRRYPAATLQAVEPSGAMRCQARKRLARLLHRTTFIDAPFAAAEIARPVDLVVFSYSLSMMNPGWREAIDKARYLLALGGWLAVVDFHDTPSRLVRAWLRWHHVRADAHLLPALKNLLQTETESLGKVAGGAWRYIMFIGTRPKKHENSNEVTHGD